MRIYIADDHTLVREGLVSMASRLCPSWVLHTFATFQAAAGALREAPCDVLVLDLFMPGMNGLSGATQLKSTYPEMIIAIMSGLASDAEIRATASSGLDGFLLKTMSGQALVAAINLMFHGERYFPVDVELKGSVGSLEFSGLEMAISALLRDGKTNKFIAKTLGIDETTVKSRVRALGAKLDARTRSEIAVKSLQLSAGVAERAE